MPEVKEINPWESPEYKCVYGAKDGKAVGGAINEAFDEVRTGSKKQQKYAQKKRTDNLQKLIIEIVENNPQITVSELERELEKLKGESTIYAIEEDKDGDMAILFFDKHEKIQSSKIKYLKDRLYRAKKKLTN